MCRSSRITRFLTRFIVRIAYFLFIFYALLSLASFFSVNVSFVTQPLTLPFSSLAHVYLILLSAWLILPPSSPFVIQFHVSDWNIGHRNFARTTAHTAISDILLNEDLNPSDAVELIDDACRTARLAGVDYQELLSRTVFKGYSDMGITPLCLEASRVELEKDGGLELLLWLVANMRPWLARAELRKGCFMRKEGEATWNMLSKFVPDSNCPCCQ